MNTSPTTGPESSIWPRTDWTGLRKVTQTENKDTYRLNQLITIYQKPLKIYLLSTFDGLEQHADDFLQEFARNKILKAGWLGKASRDRGRFRDFLKASLSNFVKDRLQPLINPPLSLEELEHDQPAPSSSSELFDLNWVRSILAETLKRMEADCKRPGKDQPRRSYTWEIFRLRILQPALEGDDLPDYEQLVQQFSIQSPADAQNMLATSKRIFTRHFETVIAEYARGGDALKIEIEELRHSIAEMCRKKTNDFAQDRVTKPV